MTIQRRKYIKSIGTAESTQAQIDARRANLEFGAKIRNIRGVIAQLRNLAHYVPLTTRTVCDMIIELEFAEATVRAEFERTKHEKKSGECP